MVRKGRSALLIVVLLLAGCRQAPDRPVATPTKLLSVPTLLEREAVGAATSAPTADIALIETVVAATVRAHTFGASPDDRPPTVGAATTATTAPCRPISSWPVYIVREGDVLSRIAQRTGSTVAELTAANCFARTTPLQIGQELHVPRLPTTPTPIPTPDPAGDKLTVVSFAVTPEVVDYDGQITISWAVRNGGSIYIWSDYWGTDLLPPSGSLTMPVTALSPRWTDMTLTLRADDPDTYEASIFEYRRLLIRSNVAINRFEVLPPTAPSNGTVAVAWSFSGATGALISWMPRPYDGVFETLAAVLTPQGTVEATLLDEFYPIPFRIAVEDEHGLWVTADTFVATTCPYTYFAVDPERQLGTCPDGAATSVTGAYQPFQRGFMVWASDDDEILAFVDNGDVYAFTDEWVGEAVEIADEPPAGMVKPTRGFGLVWAANPLLRAALGWGLAPESGYELVKQQIDIKGTRYGVLTGARYLQLPDGRVVVFHTDWNHPFQWAFLPSSGP